MATFKNINYVKRDFKTTNIVYCEADQAPDENWIEVEEIKDTERGEGGFGSSDAPSLSDIRAVEITSFDDPA